MKRLIATGIILSFSASCVCLAENYFKTLLGKSDEETQAKIEATWKHFFTPGDLSMYEADDQSPVYYLSGDDAFIMDTGNNDVRTEGMSYGMIISAQLDHPDEFEKLWRWSKANMAYAPGSPWDGYFCWQCTTDGKKLGGSNASDGELYFVTSLLLAGKRWNRPDYIAEANDILAKIMSKSGKVTGVYDLFDRDKKQITFVPDDAGKGFSDPSYHLPAFLDYWAKSADVLPEFWSDAASAARDHLASSAHPDTGLYPDYSNYDGTAYRWPQAGYDTSIYMYDAIRCPMNVGMDFYLTGKDKERQKELMRKLLTFFKNDGFTHGHFSLDGRNAFGSYSCGMAGANAVGAIALADSDNPEERALATEFMQRLWDTPLPKGKYRYYEGMVYFLSLLHVSGNFNL